jgi:hypothetical protein
MIRRTLLTRLKRIEDRIEPDQKVIIHNIDFVDETGAVVKTMRIVHGGKQQIGADEGQMTAGDRR